MTGLDVNEFDQVDFVTSSGPSQEEPNDHAHVPSTLKRKLPLFIPLGIHMFDRLNQNFRTSTEICHGCRLPQHPPYEHRVRHLSLQLLLVNFLHAFKAVEDLIEKGSTSSSGLKIALPTSQFGSKARIRTAISRKLYAKHTRKDFRFAPHLDRNSHHGSHPSHMLRNRNTTWQRE